MILFTWFADWIVFNLMDLTRGAKLSESVHFFFEDVAKIYALLVIMIYLISILRAGLNTDRIKTYLENKGRWGGYVIASGFGAITPFCSCSSIPLFLGFTSAGIPLGITMSFLITSPLINEVAVILLGSVLGFRFMAIYILLGIISGIAGGIIIDLIKADKYLTAIGKKAYEKVNSNQIDSLQFADTIKGYKNRHRFALEELKTIFKRIWIWVIVGVGLGALMHGFIPENWIINHLGQEQWWSVPGAVFLGIPLYANASGIIPAIETLIAQGLPVGTAMAFMMSVVGASFPEFMMLKQVMQPKLLVIFFIILLIFFTLSGWILNIIF